MTGQGSRAYEEAADPCFDDVQVGGEDGEPGHEGQKRCVSRSRQVQQRYRGDYSIVLVKF